MSNGHVRHQPEHPYHLVNPSPWPFGASAAAFLTAWGAVIYFHDREQPWLMIAGLALVVLVAGLWWRDVLREAIVEHAHTDVVRHGLRMGMVLFIVSEVAFFAAFFWAFFHAALGVNPSISVWPPEGIETLSAWGLPFLNTLILLASGLTVNYAHHGVRENDRGAITRGLALTVILGAVFLTLQIVEYGEAAFAFTDGVYPSVFYMATGFHGFHVFVGVVFLTVTLIRSMKGHFSAHHHVGFEAAAWYWHFVDVVWIFLFVWVYWWGG